MSDKKIIGGTQHKQGGGYTVFFVPDEAKIELRIDTAAVGVSLHMGAFSVLELIETLQMGVKMLGTKKEEEGT